MSRPKITNAMADFQANGLATRCGLEAGRLLVLCERCPGYPECSEDEAQLAAWLCDAQHWCERWDLGPGS